MRGYIDFRYIVEGVEAEGAFRRACLQEAIPSDET